VRPIPGTLTFKQAVTCTLTPLQSCSPSEKPFASSLAPPISVQLLLPRFRNSPLSHHSFWLSSSTNCPGVTFCIAVTVVFDLIHTRSQRVAELQGNLAKLERFNPGSYASHIVHNPGTRKGPSNTIKFRFLPPFLPLPAKHRFFFLVCLLPRLLSTSFNTCSLPGEGNCSVIFSSLRHRELGRD
jgi:hypothetical protein